MKFTVEFKQVGPCFARISKDQIAFQLEVLAQSIAAYGFGGMMPLVSVTQADENNSATRQPEPVRS